MSSPPRPPAATPEELVERLDALVAALASPDKATREAAGDALLSLEDPRAAGYLRALSRDRDPLARYHGKLALARLEERMRAGRAATAATRIRSRRREALLRATSWFRAWRGALLRLAALLLALAAARHALLSAREAGERAPLLAAERLRLEGKRDEARAAFAAFLAKRPTDAQALAALADLAFAGSDYESARRHLEALEAAAPGSFEFRRMAGKRLLARPAEAVPFYRALLAERPGDPQAGFECALALHLAGERAEAARALETLLARHPNFLAARTLLGELLAARGDAASSESAFTSAPALTPGGADARMRLGLARFDRGEFDRAAEAFSEALLVRPADAPLAFNLGLALERAGRDTEAARAYTDALSADPDHRAARLNLAVLLGRTGRADLETVEYRALAEREPAFAAPFFNAGVAALDARDPGRALRHFDRAVALAPRFAPALLNAGLLAEARARALGTSDPAESAILLDRARARYRAALRLDPADGAAAARLAGLEPGEPR